MAAFPRALGIDLGSKRIGVAVSSGSMATPYEVVKRSGSVAADHRALCEIADELEAEVLVVGLPLSLDGSESHSSLSARREADLLRIATNRPVETYDERFTTVTAEQQLKSQDMDAKARRKVIDKVAAAVLLQAWIDAGAPLTEEHA